MKEKRKYESPLMERTLVELEDGFCTASADVQNPNTDLGRIDNQLINTGFNESIGGNDGFVGGSWSNDTE